MAKVNSKGRTVGTARHVRHYEWMLDCPAYRALSCQARSMLVELYRLYSGDNNGLLYMSCRRAAELLNVGKNVPTKLFRELAEKGFIKVGRAASFKLKTKEATTWILTEFPVNGQLAGKDFMRWQPKAEIQNTVPPEGTDGPSTRDRETRTVPKSGTDSPSTRDRDHPSRPSHGPSRRDTGSIPRSGRRPAPNTANGMNPEQALISRVAALKGVQNLKMTPAAIVTALNPTTRKRLLADLQAGRLTDGDLTREAVVAAKAKRTERHAARIVGVAP